MVSEKEMWDVCKEIQDVLEKHNISHKHNKKIMNFVLSISDNNTQEDIYLYEVKKEFFLSLEGLEHKGVGHSNDDIEFTFGVGERYFVKLNSGEWPEIYIPGYEDWFDVTFMYDIDYIRYLTDDIGEDNYMELVPYYKWTEVDKVTEEIMTRE